MSYRPATPAEIIATITEAELTEAGKAVGLDRLKAASDLKVVDDDDLRYAAGGCDDCDMDYALRRLARDGINDPSEWTVLAVSHRDETYFDSVDGKWEYCHTNYAVVAKVA